MSVAVMIKNEIDQYVQTFPGTNRLYLATVRGEVEPKHVKAYVNGVLFLVKRVMDVLRSAERRAEILGNAPLAEFFHHKIIEEVGHDKWAERDLAGMKATVGPQSKAVEHLMDWLHTVVDEEPTLLLAYMFLAEYITVRVGGSWLQLLKEKCGIEGNMTVVSNHVELDKDHVDEALHVMDQLVGERDLGARMLDVVHESIKYYEQFWDEVLDNA